MPRAAFLFVFVGLFAIAWSNDPGLAAAPTPSTPAPAKLNREPVTPGKTDLPRPMAERYPQCDSASVLHHRLSRVR
jgi:hypothetical protein